MKTTHSLLLTLICSLFMFTNAYAGDSGLINFNLGKSPVSDSPVQPVSLFGCNETINTNVFWDTNNQIVGDIPYGKRRSKKSDKEYFVSKYYIASPPASRHQQKSNSKKSNSKNSKQKPPYIGLVTPDRFTFHGKKPAQIVYFDYRILKPTELKFVSIDYHHKNNAKNTCASLGVDSIPVNTQCSDFPWRNGALGASGIGDITKQSNRVFLPLIGEGKEKKPLNCTVSILDDIMLDHDVYFLDKDKRQVRTQSLTEHYINNQDMTLVCYRRDKKDIPIGCRP